MIEQLPMQLLACPHDGVVLERSTSGYHCTACHRSYPAANGVIHFLNNDADRPSEVMGLAHLPEVQGMELYEQNAANARQEQQGHPAMCEMLKAVAGHGPVIVDLATGPGGGYVASLLDIVNKDTIVFGTDACPPVVEHQAKLFGLDHGDHFWMLDVDLNHRLPFRDESVSCFTGAGIINISGVAATLMETVRCLKPGGLTVLGETFYADGSVTAKYLAGRGHPFASMASLQAYGESIGLTVEGQIDIIHQIGKSDPRDGLPLCETDEWTSTLVTLRKYQ